MTKGQKPSKVITAAAPRPALKQARLIGLNNHIKSIRQKTNPNSTCDGPKQVGLAAFGFGNANPNASACKNTRDGALETPPPKRRKRRSFSAEVPETQFAQYTQSPELGTLGAFTGDHGAIGGSDYSSPLSSPPSEGSSPLSVDTTNSALAMPPPPIPAEPVTPKRRRVVEIPDSKSPPFTPFSPYRSQKKESRLKSQTSPTARLSKHPIVLEGDVGVSDEYHSPTPTPSQGLFSSIPKSFQDKKSKEEIRDVKGKLMEIGEVMEGAQVAVGNRGRIIDSSQWWENEDTHDASIFTQYTPKTQVLGTKSIFEGIGKDLELPETEVGPASDGESFCVDLSYKGGPLFEHDDSDNALESRGASRMDDESDVQQPPHSMTYLIPLEFHDDTPEPESRGKDLVLPMDGDRASSTASEEEEILEDRGGESQEYPEYRAYRTQQLPSSFCQNSTYQPSSPEFPPSSQFILSEIVNKSDHAIKYQKHDNDGRDPPQFLPGTLVELDVATRDERDGSSDEGVPSQFLPEIASSVHSTVEIEGDSILDTYQFLHGILSEPNTAAIDKESGNGGKDIKWESEDDDDGSGAITRSQLLPSELMETFPMPPPLSQYSSYGYDYDGLGISET